MYHKVAMVVVLCVVLCILIATIEDEAFAATKTKMIERHGVGGSLGTKEIDKKKLATKSQMWIGFGSVAVAFAVVKFW